MLVSFSWLKTVVDVQGTVAQVFDKGFGRFGVAFLRRSPQKI